jgi:hypothetical protein
MGMLRVESSTTVTAADCIRWSRWARRIARIDTERPSAKGCFRARLMPRLGARTWAFIRRNAYLGRSDERPALDGSTTRLRLQHPRPHRR